MHTLNNFVYCIHKDPIKIENFSRDLDFIKKEQMKIQT